MTERTADGLDEFLSQVADRIAGSEVVGFDETGLRVAGTLHWLHCARTGKYTLLTCHPKRGTAGIDDAGILTRFRGVAVHDAWAPYDTYFDVDHQLCCAHAQRELQAVTDTAPDADWCWAKLRQKVSGCLRTLTGAQQFCTIRSYLSTAARHGWNLFDTLVMLAEGQPCCPQLTDHRSAI